MGKAIVLARRQAGGSLRTRTRPTMIILLLFRLLRSFVWAITLKPSQVPISVECLFSMTLLAGGSALD